MVRKLQEKQQQSLQEEQQQGKQKQQEIQQQEQQIKVRYKSNSKEEEITNHR